MKTINNNIAKKVMVAMLALAIAIPATYAQRESSRSTQQRSSSRTVTSSKRQEQPKSTNSRIQSSSRRQATSTSRHKPVETKKYDHRKSALKISHDSKSSHGHKTYHAPKYEPKHHAHKYDPKSYHNSHKYNHYNHHKYHSQNAHRHFTHYWKYHFPSHKYHRFTYRYEPVFYRHNFHKRIPRRSVYLILDGVGLYYYKGKFYLPVEYGYFRVKAPRYIQTLPDGCYYEMVHGKPYYHFNGIHFSLTSRGFKLHI